MIVKINGKIYQAFEPEEIRTLLYELSCNLPILHFEDIGIKLIPPEKFNTFSYTELVDKLIEMIPENSKALELKKK